MNDVDLVDRDLIEALQSLKANQTLIAGLLGLSQPTIAKMLNKGVIEKDGTYGEWLPALVNHYQTGSAGRGGQDLQRELTLVKIESERETGLEKKINRLTKQGEIILKNDLLSTLTQFAATVQFQIETIGEKVIETIASKLDVEFDEQLITKHIRSALGNIESSTTELSRSLGGGGTSSQVCRETTDTDMV